MRGRRTASATALGGFVLTLLLTACGGEAADDSDAAGPPSPGATRDSGTTPTPSPSRTAAPRAEVLDVVALPAAGGESDPAPEPVTRPAEVTAYAARFPPASRGPLRAAIDEVVVPSGLDLNAAVVLIGCEEPAEVLLDPAGATRWTVKAVPPRATVQCLVPVTYVALVGLPS